MDSCMNECLYCLGMYQLRVTATRRSEVAIGPIFQPLAQGYAMLACSLIVGDTCSHTAPGVATCMHNCDHLAFFLSLPSHLVCASQGA